jgi:hypothetical protein
LISVAPAASSATPQSPGEYIAGRKGPGGGLLQKLSTFQCLDGGGQVCCCMAWNVKKTTE